MNQKELTDKIKKGHEVLDIYENDEGEPTECDGVAWDNIPKRPVMKGTSLSDPPKGSYQEYLNNKLKERKEKNSKW